MNKSFSVTNNLSKFKSFVGLLVTLVASVSPFSALTVNERVAAGFSGAGLLIGLGVLTAYILAALALNLEFAKVSKLGPIRAHGRLTMFNYIFAGLNAVAVGSVTVALCIVAYIVHRNW